MSDLRSHNHWPRYCAGCGEALHPGDVVACTVLAGRQVYPSESWCGRCAPRAEELLGVTPLSGSVRPLEMSKEVVS